MRLVKLYRGPVVSAMLFLGILLGFAGLSSAREKIRIAYPAGVNLFWPFYVGEAKGLFRAQGLDVEMIAINSAATVVQTLVSEDVDFAATGTVAALAPFFRGLPIVAVSGHDRRSPYQVYSVPEIKSVKDLKGKLVVSGAPGGPPHMAMTVILQAAGLDIRKDVQSMNIAGGQSRFAALKARQIAATILNPPFIFVAREEGYNRLADAADFLKEDQNNVVITSRHLLANEPNKVKQFLSAVVKSIRFIRSNREETLTIVERYTKQPRRGLEETYDFFVPGISEEVSIKGISNIANYLKEWAIVKEIKNLENFVDTRFVSAAR